MTKNPEKRVRKLLSLSRSPLKADKNRAGAGAVAMLRSLPIDSHPIWADSLTEVASNTGYSLPAIRQLETLYLGTPRGDLRRDIYANLVERTTYRLSFMERVISSLGLA